MLTRAPKKLRRHPTLLRVHDLNDLCKPLAHLEITTFSHLKVSQGNQLAVLCNHPRSLANYVQKKYYEADPCVNIKLESTDIGQYLVWDAVECRGKTAEMLADSASLDYRHVFTIIKKEADVSHFYHFGTHKINPSIHLMYINNLDLLDRFITYFNTQVNQSKTLLNAYDIVLNANQKTSSVALGEKNTLLDNFQDRRKMCLQGMLPKDIPHLTLRETQCIQLLVNKMTAKEIAKKVGLSYRSIEDRINVLKDKFDVSTKADLLAKLILLKQ